MDVIVSDSDQKPLCTTTVFEIMYATKPCAAARVLRSQGTMPSRVYNLQSVHMDSPGAFQTPTPIHVTGRKFDKRTFCKLLHVESVAMTDKLNPPTLHAHRTVPIPLIPPLPSRSY